MSSGSMICDTPVCAAVGSVLPPVGFPRPQVDGLLLPFISGGPDAGFHQNIDAAAAEFCATGWACQVCGLPTGLGDWVIVATTGGAGGGEVGWSVLDQAPMHLPCLRMAVRMCPHLNDVSGSDPEYVACRVADAAVSVCVDGRLAKVHSLDRRVLFKNLADVRDVDVSTLEGVEFQPMTADATTLMIDTIYPSTLREIASTMDAVNETGWAPVYGDTDQNLDDIEMMFVVDSDHLPFEPVGAIGLLTEADIAAAETPQHGFGWIVPSAYGSGYAFTPTVDTYADEAFTSAQLREIAALLDGLDSAHDIAMKVGRDGISGLGLTSTIPIIIGGDDTAIVGHAVDEIGGAYCYQARKAAP